MQIGGITGGGITGCFGISGTQIDGIAGGEITGGFGISGTLIGGITGGGKHSGTCGNETTRLADSAAKTTNNKKLIVSLIMVLQQSIIFTNELITLSDQFCFYMIFSPANICHNQIFS